MHLIYVDDSFEKPHQIYAAIAIPANRWDECFQAVKEWRRKLKASDGILVTKEFHATDFCAGRGRLGSQVVGKYRRSQLFNDALRLLNGLPIKIFTVCHTRKPEWALERLLTRINKTLGEWDSYGVMYLDEGKEAEITRLFRKLSSSPTTGTSYC